MKSDHDIRQKIDGAEVLGGEARSDGEAAVARLAKLPALEYDRVRHEEAKQLGVRVPTLDAGVEARRASAAEPESASGQGRRLELAERKPWPEPVDGARLLADLKQQIQRFVCLSDEAALAIALWILHAHAHDAALHSPRLTITSPTMRCGKSSLLRCIGPLVPRPLSSSNITPAALFRVIEAARPTLLIDEADSFAHGNEELRGIVNSSHCRLDACVIRTVGETYEPRSFTTWAPMAIAAIGRPARTIVDRSVLVEMQRKPSAVRVERLRIDQDQGFAELARKAARCSADMFQHLRAADPEVPAGLNDRAADNWRPLLAIADAAGGAWPEEARRAALALSGSDDGDDSTAVMLLADMRAIFEDCGTDKVPSQTIVDTLIGMEGRPWAGWRRGQPINVGGMARLLKPFGIAPSTLRDGDRTFKGYRRPQFEDAWERYLPSEGATPDRGVRPSRPSNPAGFGDSRPVTGKPHVTAANPPNGSGSPACDAVTDETAGRAREQPCKVRL